MASLASIRGRPPIGRDPHLVIRARDDALARIAEYAAENGLKRAEAVRQLLDLALETVASQKEDRD